MSNKREKHENKQESARENQEPSEKLVETLNNFK